MGVNALVSGSGVGDLLFQDAGASDDVLFQDVLKTSRCEFVAITPSFQAEARFSLYIDLVVCSSPRPAWHGGNCFILTESRICAPFGTADGEQRANLITWP